MKKKVDKKIINKALIEFQKSNFKKRFRQSLYIKTNKLDKLVEDEKP